MTARSCTLVCCIALAGLAGCASAPQNTGPTDPVLDALNRKAVQVTRLLGIIASSTQTDAVQPKIYPIPHTGPLSRLVNLQWYGSLDAAARSIALLIGYQFEVVGQPPASPMLVAVDAHERPAYAVLQDIGWQGGKQAVVVVRPEKHLIEVVYNGATL